MNLKIFRFLIILTIATLSLPSGILNEKKEYDLSRNLIYQIEDKVENYAKFEELPIEFVNALVSAEDKRFYHHIGFDPIAIGNALYVDIKEKRFVLGGSTLSQQLCKNMFLNPNKKLERKFKELILSIRIERQYSKNEIIEMYSNVIYYGNGAYGIKDAAKTYFQKPLKELNVQECAFLAGLPKGPSRYNPNENYNRALKRRNKVLSLMLKNNYISKIEYEQLKNEPIELKAISENEIAFFIYKHLFE